MSAIRSPAALAWWPILIADMDAKMARGTQAPGAKELAASF